MQKQLRLISLRQVRVCPFSVGFFAVPPLPPLVFGRHARRLPRVFSALVGVRVVRLPRCGWYLWLFPSGARQVSALPF